MSSIRVLRVAENTNSRNGKKCDLMSGAHSSADFDNILMQILKVVSLPMPISSIMEVRRLSWKFADMKLIMEHCRLAIPYVYDPKS